MHNGNNIISNGTSVYSLCNSINANRDLHIHDRKRQRMIPTFTITNNESGEVITNSHKAKVRRSKERFVLTFIKSLTELYQHGINYQVLNEILLQMDGRNMVFLQDSFKTKASERLGLSKRRIEAVITELTVANVLKRVGRGHYIVNPHYFGMGNINKIKKMRMEYDL